MSSDPVAITSDQKRSGDGMRATGSEIDIGFACGSAEVAGTLPVRRRPTAVEREGARLAYSRPAT